MDIIPTLYTRRRAHLQRLISERFGGNQSAFARAVERNSSEISRWLKLPEGKNSWPRNIGEISARRIEKQLGLASGYLDQPVPSHAGKNAPNALNEPKGEYQTNEPSGTAISTNKEIQCEFPCPHDNGEAQCRHCALVKKITDTLQALSYEDVQTISRLVNTFRDQD